jgi:redox-sensitive bicupin YhaK (pirin superfamily)
MRAGSGVLHSEMPTTDSDGLHGFQVWINLPARLKMSKPAYRDVQTDEIPTINFQGGHARIIADHWQFNGVQAQGALSTLGDGAGMAQLQIEAKATVSVHIPAGFRLLAYVFDGSVQATHASPRQESGALLSFPLGTTAIDLHSETGAGLLLLSGKPLDEPIAHRGPFVMNTEAEITQAIHDYQTGAMGRLDA